MKLILINLYSRDTVARYMPSSYVLKAYLSSIFNGEDDLSVEVLNFDAALGTDRICAEIVGKKPDLVGYSGYIWNIEKILKVIEKLREITPLIHILGGPEISPDRIRSFSSRAAADYYVIGEGEKVLAGLVAHLKAKAGPSGTPIPAGVAYRDGGGLVFSENTATVDDLDEIPSIYLTGAIEERLYAGRQAFLETQRGCPHKCKYCVYHMSLPRVRFYSLPRVYEELDHLIVRKKVMALRILDAVFTSDLPRAKSIMRHLLELKAKGVSLPWIYWHLSINTADEECLGLIGALKRRGKILNTDACPALDRPQFYSELLNGYTVINGIGFQSFHGPALKAIGRESVTAEKFISFMERAKKHNIVLKVDLILGLPFETPGSYFDGLEFILPFFENTDHLLNIHRLQILPGSELETLSGEYGIVYSEAAPHYVFSTRSFPAQGLEYASKLSAVLFRVLNSPLRRSFFEAKRRSGDSYRDLVRRLFDAITASGKFGNTRLLKDALVEDEYWNGEIFKEIPSDWLAEILEQDKRAPKP